MLRTIDLELAVGSDADRVAHVAVAHQAWHAGDDIKPISHPPAVRHALVVCACERCIAHPRRPIVVHRDFRLPSVPVSACRPYIQSEIVQSAPCSVDSCV